MSAIFALVFLIRKLMKSKDPIKTLLTLNPLELLGLEALLGMAVTLVAALAIVVFTN